MKRKMKFTGRKAALHTLGCKVNVYETDAMRAMLEEEGFEIVPFDAPADVYVINTCSVTNIADRKSRQMIHRARKMNPDSVVVAAGCYVQTALDKTGKTVDADIILGAVGIVMADAFLGEITPAMALAVGQSRAEKILIPMNRCGIMIAGCTGRTTAQYVADAVEQVRILTGSQDRSQK